MKRLIAAVFTALFMLCSTVTNAFTYDVPDLERRAAQGDVEALIDLGYAYDFGDGTSVDHRKAVEYWEKAIQHPRWNIEFTEGLNKGLAGEVYFNLGIMYANGRGVRQDYHKAVEYYQKAAALRHASAMFNLGVSYYNGEGVRQDKRIAKEWYGKACDHGNQKGCDEYRKLNEKGY